MRARAVGGMVMGQDFDTLQNVQQNNENQPGRNDNQAAPTKPHHHSKKEKEKAISTLAPDEGFI